MPLGQGQEGRRGVARPLGRQGPKVLAVPRIGQVAVKVEQLLNGRVLPLGCVQGVPAEDLLGQVEGALLGLGQVRPPALLSGLAEILVRVFPVRELWRHIDPDTGPH